MGLLMQGALIALAAATLSAIGFIVISRWVPDKWLIADSEAASVVYTTVGMVYAIIIAIAAIALWEPRGDADQASSREAADIAEVHWAARTLPGGPEVQRLATDYTRIVIEKEWPVLSERHESLPEAQRALDTLRTKVEAIQPVGEAQATSYRQARDRILDAYDARRTRISAADEAMPALLWPVLIIGGLISVGFLYVFGLERTFPNAAMMAILGAAVAMLLFLLYQMEFPYSRGLAVQPEAFETALEQMGVTGGR